MNINEYRALGETVCYDKLDNGLSVIVIPKKGYSKSLAFFATDYGSLDLSFTLDGKEHSTPPGVAHYLEHKMFDTKEGNALQLLARNSASPNAFTSYAITAYYFECTQKFDDSLKILLNFVSDPYFTEESVEKERGIITQELRMYDDYPEMRAYQNLLKIMYEKHPIRIPIVGTVESLADITADTLYQCHSAFYNPANMVLCAVGNVDIESVVKTAKEVLPAQYHTNVKRGRAVDEPLTLQKQELSENMDVAMPIFSAGFKMKPVSSGREELRREMVAELSCELLMGDSSPLYSRMYGEGLINASFSAGYEGYDGASHVIVAGDCKEPDRVMGRVLKECERVASAGADEALFKRLKKAYYGDRIREFNSFNSICHHQSLYYFRGCNYFEFPEIYDQITADEVHQFIAQNLKPESYAISTIFPK